MRESSVFARPRAHGLKRVLILGGTRDARDLARRLVARGDLAVVSSLAGRTRDPILPPGEVRIGGFGGVDGLARYLRERRIDLVVDATHPFAARITHNAAAACERERVRVFVVARPPWLARPGDRWIEAADLVDAAEAARERGRRIFVTTGRTELAPFAAIGDRWFLIRAIDPPSAPLPPRHEIVLDRGPFAYADERRLLEAHRIDCVVAKNAGGPSTAAKLDAARDLGIPVVMIRRPEPPGSLALASSPAALDAALEEFLGDPPSLKTLMARKN